MNIGTLVAALLLVPSPAVAEAVLFTDRAAFNAAVGEHALFTDFDLRHVPGTYDVEGDLGGVHFRREVFEITWGGFGPVETLTATGVHSEGRSNGFFLPTAPLRAFGFDLLSAFTFREPPNFGLPFEDRPLPVPTEVFFNYRTGALPGHEPAPSVLVPVGGFFGALIYDDAFTAISILTAQPTCICQSGLSIDNLAVQAVPEPATVALLGLGLAGLFVVRRR